MRQFTRSGLACFELACARREGTKGFREGKGEGCRKSHEERVGLLRAGLGIRRGENERERAHALKKSSPEEAPGEEKNEFYNTRACTHNLHGDGGPRGLGRDVAAADGDVARLEARKKGKVKSREKKRELERRKEIRHWVRARYRILQAAPKEGREGESEVRNRPALLHSLAKSIVESRKRTPSESEPEGHEPKPLNCPTGGETGFRLMAFLSKKTFERL